MAAPRSVRPVPIALALGVALLLGPAAPPVTAAPADPCVTRPARCPHVKWLYEYDYSLGFHPFTTPHRIREQLTDHFWLFPVSGGCRGDVHVGRECPLLGDNPVRIELVGADYFQITTLPGHTLGSNLHIRFTFSRVLGVHALTVRAWQNDPAGPGGRGFTGQAGRLLAWPLWAVLAQTLSVSALVA